VKSGLSKVNPTLSGSSSPLIPQPLIHSAASSIAELFACFFLTPAEVLKQNAQVMRKPAGDAASSTSRVFQASATLQTMRKFKHPSQLWRGYTALAARNLPFTAMHFPIFEHLKKAIKQHRKDKGTFTGTLGETAMITAISAGCAASVAAVITTPVDVVKTRIMLSAAGESSEKTAREEVEKSKKYGESLKDVAEKTGGSKKSGFMVAQEVFKDSGMRGLFRGGTLRAVWTALGSALYLGVYESGRVWLGERRGNLTEDLS
jgi:solute carrier family 25 S-adenosylmethionine transporter 26